MSLNIDYHPSQGHASHGNSFFSCFPPPPLSHWVESFWQLDVPTGEYFYRSVPDNSVDLIINVDCPEDIFIVTPFSSSIIFKMEGPTSYFGIRFRILGHRGLISVPLGEWSESSNEINAAELLEESILNDVFQCVSPSNDFTHRCSNLSQILIGAMQLTTVDRRLTRYIRYAHKNISSSISLSDRQCSEFGLSARHLRRLVHLYLGLSPRDYMRVLRFQHMLRIINTTDCGTVWQDHYYDQAHFIREFKSLSGLTPKKFSSLSVLYNNNQ